MLICSAEGQWFEAHIKKSLFRCSFTLWSLINGEILLIFGMFLTPQCLLKPPLFTFGNQFMEDYLDDVDRNILKGIFDDDF